MYHVDVLSGCIVLESKAAQAFKGLVPVEFVPKKGTSCTRNPAPLSLLNVRLELPMIVFVTFVQVSAEREPVSNT